MAEKAPIKRGGKYCVAGTRDNISSTNTSVCNISLSTQFFLLDNTQLINYLIQDNTSFYIYKKVSVMISTEGLPDSTMKKVNEK